MVRQDCCAASGGLLFILRIRGSQLSTSNKGKACSDWCSSVILHWKGDEREGPGFVDILQREGDSH